MQNAAAQRTTCAQQAFDPTAPADHAVKDEHPPKDVDRAERANPVLDGRTSPATSTEPWRHLAKREARQRVAH